MAEGGWSRIYRLALRAYPARVRRRDGTDMLHLFQDMVEGARRRKGRMAAATTALRILADVPRSSWRARFGSKASGGHGLLSGAMNALAQDVAFGFRVVRKRPTFAVIAVVTLALGVGANAAVFSLARTLLVRPVEGVRAAGVFTITARRGDGSSDAIFSYQDYQLLKEDEGVAQVAAHYSTAPLTEGAGGGREVSGAVVSSNFFQVLGVQPARGRFFTPEEETLRGGAPVAVISDAFWRERFLGAPDALGAQIRLNGVVFTVVGIAPPDFHGILATWHNDLWLPLSMLGTAYRWCDPFQPECDTLGFVGRVRSGVTLERAQATFAALAPRLTSERGDNGPRTLELTRLGGLRPGPAREIWRRNILLLFLAGGLILVVACANLAGALLSSGLARRGELEVRMSLGASPARVRSQLLTESLILAVAGAGAGVFVAMRIQAVMAAMYAVDSEGYPLPLDLRLDPTVMAFTLGLALATGIAFGLAPAWRASRAGIGMAAREGGGRTVNRAPFAAPLAALQVALTVAALVGAGLLARSAASIGAGTALDPSHVVLFRARPRLVGYDAQRAHAYTAEVLRRLEVTPGVRSATMADGVGHVWGNGASAPAWPSDAPTPDSGRAPTVGLKQVAPRFFETLGVAVEGREFNSGDGPEADPVAIVDRTLAREFWPDGHALGRDLVVAGRTRRIVGVVPAMSVHSATEPARPLVWTPYAQDPSLVDARFAVRVAGDPAVRLPEVVRAAHDVNPAVPVSETLTMSTQVRAAFRSVRVIALAVAYSALLAVILATMGLYGVVAFTVASRRRAIAVRKALGAASSDIVRGLAREVGVILAAGAALGVVLSLGLARALAHLAYGVAPWDPMTFAGAVVVLVAFTVPAFAWPTRRALAIEAREALAEG